MAGDQRNRTVCAPNLHRSKPCICWYVHSGFDSRGEPSQASIKALLTEYPQLPREDGQATLLCAAEVPYNTLVT
jgi:hypothetical protein